MSNKKINDFILRTTIADEDFVPFWSEADNVTCRITFENFITAIKAKLANDGIIGKSPYNGHYYRMVLNDSQEWIMAEDLGTTYP